MPRLQNGDDDYGKVVEKAQNSSLTDGEAGFNV